MLDAHSIRIMKRTSECRINERVWKLHNAYGRRSISRICWLPIVLQQKWSMYLLTWTRELSTYLRSFFHSSACTLCSLSLLFYYIRPSSISNSPRFHAYCYFPLFCLSHASPGSHFFSSLLFSGSFVQCAQLYLQFLTFPITGRSITIALSGDVQTRIKAHFPFQNILSRLWSVKISLTDGPSCWIHLVKPWICGLSSILHCRKMGRRSNGLSE
jgi:hypothetical protein